MNIDELDTPVGTVRLEFDAAGLHSVTIMRGRHKEAERVSGSRAQYPQRAAFDRYFSGDLHTLSELTVVMHGTDFQRRVWRTLRGIPPGSTLTYAQLAERIGNQKAMRAVGSANGRNPLHIVVPCHRVIRTDGSLGGFSAGLDAKRWLLQHEGAAFQATA